MGSIIGAGIAALIGLVLAGVGTFTVVQLAANPSATQIKASLIAPYGSR